MSRWLVTGAAGMLGRDLVVALDSRGADVLGLDREDLDITDEAAVCAALRDQRPGIVVNCAAWTAVDAAETREGEALAVNGIGAGQLARAIAAGCAAPGCRLVHMSTDYVFAGDAKQPYAESDLPAPRTAYGRTKLAGELAVRQALPLASYVLRTAWLYGAHGPNFVRTMIRLERQRQIVDVVADQHGQPTWSADVARQVIALAGSGAPPGVYHATSSGETTWFELAREVFRLLGADHDRVRGAQSDSFRRPAPRPAYSVLGHEGWAAAGVKPIGHWRLALHQAFPALVETA
jgi:dTDP-4-dehydrorhamnose reductase